MVTLRYLFSMADMEELQAIKKDLEIAVRVMRNRRKRGQSVPAYKITRKSWKRLAAVMALAKTTGLTFEGVKAVDAMAHAVAKEDR